jgi:PhnB protein
MTVQAIPAGYETVTPYLIVHDAAAALDYYKKAFGAVELMRFAGKDGRIHHAEMRVGRGVVMLADEVEGHKGPRSLGGTPVSLMFYVDDVDAVYARAIAGGGTSMRAVADQFYGDRSGGITDPFGHSWWISTHKEDVSEEEMQKRMQAMG